ncbi:unnamed protein product [Amoebophrya sp. A25]|nr:unnamed protein product [Amoebophrya sp. A25]|eukprot:GSA25T00025069001.1
MAAVAADASSWWYGVLAAFLAALGYAGQSTLIGLTKIYEIKYDTQVAVMLAEVLKIFASLLLGLRQWIGEKQKAGKVVAATGDGGNRSTTATTSIKRFFLGEISVVVPALCYAIQNNLMFWTLSHGWLSAPHYQMFCNAKIAVTSLLFRVVVNKPLTVLQWCALLLLTLGMLVSGRDAFEKGGKTSTRTSSNTTTRSSTSPPSSDFIKGLASVLGMCLCSAVAGVTNEILLKKAGNMHFANVKMYVIGICFSILHMELESYQEKEGLGGLQQGQAEARLGKKMTNGQASATTSTAFSEEQVGFGFFSLASTTRTKAFLQESGLYFFDTQPRTSPSNNAPFLIPAVLVVQAYLGLCISFIFRFGDVILKIYQVSLTTIFTTYIAYQLHGFEVSIGFMLGYPIIMLSTLFFYAPADLLHRKDDALCRRRPGGSGGKEKTQ